MTKFILIRHGEPDYSFLKDKNFKGHGNDLAFLTPNGINQAKIVSRDERLKNSQILLSSPYTRTMQTASIISSELHLPIIGEIDLHEWLPDLTFNYKDKETIQTNYFKAKKDFTEGNFYTNKNYEFLFTVRQRALKVFLKYLNYDKVIVVTHGEIICSFINKTPYYCRINESECDEESIQKLILKH